MIIERYNDSRLDFIKTLSNTLGIVSVAIGILLLPLFGWLFWQGIRERDKTSVIVSVFILAFAVLVFIGAYYMLTQGLLRTAT
jgi:NhaP-type Na+/H+ and K+/H+ antiporter